jgi:hypothetical protein
MKTGNCRRQHQTAAGGLYSVTGEMIMRFTILPVFLIGVTLSGQVSMKGGGNETSAIPLSTGDRPGIEAGPVTLASGFNNSESSRQVYKVSVQ